MQKKISVCFPAFNEEKNIGIILDECLGVLSKQAFEWEIVVVNDGSKDNTENIVKGYMGRNKKIRLVNHPQNMGYSAAINTCFKEAKGDIIFAIDSDRQYDLNDIPKFVEEATKGFDAVIGKRIDLKNDPARKFLSKGYSFLFRILFNTKDYDIDCGFRAVTKDVANKISIKHRGVPVGAEFFAYIKAFGFKTSRISMQHYYRKEGKSLFKSWKMPFTVTRIFLDLVKLRIETRKIKNEGSPD